MHVRLLAGGKLALTNTDGIGRLLPEHTYQEVWLPEHMRQALMLSQQTPATDPPFGTIREVLQDFAFHCWFCLHDLEPSFTVALTHYGTGIFGDGFHWRYSTPYKREQRARLLRVVRSVLDGYPMVQKLVVPSQLYIDEEHEEDAAIVLPFKEAQTPLKLRVHAEMMAGGNHWGEIATEEDYKAFRHDNDTEDCDE